MDIEGIIIVWLAGLAFLPAIIRLRRRLSAGAGMVVLIAWIGGATSLGFYAVKQRPTIIPESEIKDRPIQSDSGGYVTSKTCQSCHPDAYHSWHDSYHRTMTQLPTPANVVGDFDNVTVQFRGHTYHLERRGDEFWAELDDLNATDSGVVRPRIKRQIKLLTGSHHMQTYWLSAGAGPKLSILPIVWLNEADRWIPRSASLLLPPFVDVSNESGRWNESCLRCHTTNEQPHWQDEDHMDTRVGEFGIACEACHGPGHEHIKAHSEPLGRYARRLRDQDDSTIAHPAKLTVDRSSEICGQCHAILLESSVFERARWLEIGKSFRPGDVLTNSLRPVRTSDKELIQAQFGGIKQMELGSFWSDGMVRVSGREYNGLLESPCYVHGAGEQKLSCLSCHQMHRAADDKRPLSEWTDDQLKPGMRGDQACLQCHQQFANRIEEHTHHPLSSEGSRCYNCHMPHTTYGLLKAIRSHKIDSPSVAASIATGRPNACNQCHLDKTLEWTAARLSEWHDIKPPQLSADEAGVAASVLWTLRGDAGQRAIMAWSFGWDSARATSGSEWMAPYLAQLIADPYDAVRYIAQRSLRRLPGYESFEFEFTAPEAQLREASERALQIWTDRRIESGLSGYEDSLINPDGTLQTETITRLLLQRDNSPIALNE
jgi:hypothetical protein